MSTTLQEILDQARDYGGSYSTGQLDEQVIIRAVNRSIELLKRKIGFPGDEKIRTFMFSDDQMYYDLAADHDEGFQLVYHDPRLNSPQRSWDYESYPDILRRSGVGDDFKFSFTSINGRNQIMMLGRNLKTGSTISSMDSTDDWTATGRASGLELDSLDFYDGDSSIRFDVDNEAGTYAGILLSDQTLDLEQLFQSSGKIKFWTKMASANITDVRLLVKTDSSNYYTITSTTQDDGNAFVADSWTKIGFDVDDAVETGTVDLNDITEVEIRYTLGPAFTSASNFRADLIFYTFPDEMDLIYYSRYKGTDTTGVTDKVNLTLATDIVAFGDFFPDYLDLVAMQTAIKIWPALRGDVEFFSSYRTDLNDWIRTMTRTYPRKRTQGSYKTYLRRN